MIYHNFPHSHRPPLACIFGLHFPQKEVFPICTTRSSMHQHVLTSLCRNVAMLSTYLAHCIQMAQYRLAFRFERAGLPFFMHLLLFCLFTAINKMNDTGSLRKYVLCAHCFELCNLFSDLLQTKCCASKKKCDYVWGCKFHGDIFCLVHHYKNSEAFCL